MRHLIKIGFLLVCLNTSGQNNAIFNGGAGDGWSKIGFQQSENNLFSGGVGDGWSTTNFQQPENNIFSGGIGDGWTDSESESFQLIVDNISETGFGSALSVFPNPTDNGMIKIDLNSDFGNLEMEVYNSSGQMISTKQLNSASLINLEILGSAGVYLIKIKSDHRFATIRVIKQR